MISLLISLLIILLILGAIYYALRLLPLPPQFMLIAQIILIIIFVLILVGYLLPLVTDRRVF